jgi:hypothetical protein
MVNSKHLSLITSSLSSEIGVIRSVFRETRFYVGRQRRCGVTWVGDPRSACPALKVDHSSPCGAPPHHLFWQTHQARPRMAGTCHRLYRLPHPPGIVAAAFILVAQGYLPRLAYRAAPLAINS